MKKRKQTENGKTPWSEQPVIKSVCGSLTMRWRAASATIIRHWMHNLQVGENSGPWKVHSAWTLHQDCAGKEGPKLNWYSPTSEVAYATVTRDCDSSEQRMPLLRRQGRTRTSNKFWGWGGVGWGWGESETNLSHLFVSLYDIVLTFPQW